MRAVITLVVGTIALLASSNVTASITLSGVSYTENFNSLGSGLPTGVTVTVGATSSSLGTPGATFVSATTSWGTATGNFRNMASVDASGLSSGSDATTQASATDRALGVRQTEAFGDPGAAFTFEILNTLGFQGFTLSFLSEMASAQARSTIWTVRYGIGTSPLTFTTLGTISDTGVFGATSHSYSLGSDVNNLNQKLWIQVAALTAATGSGSRDTFGIDEFRLTYSAVPAVPEMSSIFSFGGLLIGFLAIKLGAGRRLPHGGA